MRGAAKLLCAALLAICAALGAVRAQAPPSVNARLLLADAPAPRLSDYRLFLDAAGRTPNRGVTPYALNTELYADGALKFRYVFVPEGRAAAYNDAGVFAFPVGTVLVKTFAAPGEPGAERYIETRLLIHRAEGWVAYPYVWNAEQTEAVYAPIGAEIPVRWMEGETQIALDWRVPNRNQCKGCHDTDGEITPIGPSARNLNRDAPQGGGNQIVLWSGLGILANAPPADWPLAPDAFGTAALDLRARTYLDVNCAHCHNPRGPAHTSGLDLRLSTTEPYAWGVLKPPVAAGRASGGFAHSIEPGAPERSILLHRMNSVDPGVMMPELGRQRIDERAVTLITEWIAGMDATGAQAP